MNFFWKLYFSLMIVTMALFSVGGYLLIQSGFRGSMDRETIMAYQENEILSDALQQSLDWSSSTALKRQQTEEENYKLLKKMAETVTVESSGKIIPYAIKDEKGKVYAGKDFVGAAEALVKYLNLTERGYKIIQKGNSYYILCGSPLKMMDWPFYVESYRDITPLFENRQAQYKSYISLLLLLFVASIVITFIVSTWLMRPIRKLSLAARQLSGGQSIEPVPVYSKDEIGQLTEDFNSMAGKLAENVEELKEAAQRQELFVSSFNHELKTPLTSMIGYADLLRSKKLSEEQVIVSADQIVQEGRRLEKLSAMLMDLVVIKKQEVPLKLVSAKIFLMSVRNTVLPIMKKKQIDFRVSLEDEPLLLEPHLMKTVCINLLDNAYKAVQHGGVVSLSGVGRDGDYEITVSDNGCGIPQEEISKITEAFYMVDKARARAGGGAGLGLTICAEIVKLHNGTLTFVSPNSCGTQVTVRLRRDADNETL